MREIFEKFGDLEVYIRDDFEGYASDCKVARIVKETHGVVLRLQ